MIEKKSEKIKEIILEFVARKARYVTIEDILKELNEKGMKTSRPTINKYINELIKKGLVEEEK